MMIGCDGEKMSDQFSILTISIDLYYAIMHVIGSGKEAKGLEPHPQFLFSFQGM